MFDVHGAPTARSAADTGGLGDDALVEADEGAGEQFAPDRVELRDHDVVILVQPGDERLDGFGVVVADHALRRRARHADSKRAGPLRIATLTQSSGCKGLVA
jgi:hypothetical protein